MINPSTSDKFTDISVSRDGIVLNNGKESSSWLTISNGLVYLYWDQGRLYFMLNSIKSDNDIINSIRTHIPNKTFSFDYYGPWDNCDTGADENVHYSFDVQFLHDGDIECVSQLLKKYCI